MFATNKAVFSRILIGIDGSAQAAWAATVAGNLAERLSAEVMLVNVVEPTMPVDGDMLTAERIDGLRRQNGMELLERTRLSIPVGVKATCLQRIGIPSEEIACSAREWKADLVVVGTRGRGRLSRFVLGSTADAIIRQSDCPVISVTHEPAFAKNDPGEIVGLSAAGVHSSMPDICDWMSE